MPLSPSVLESDQLQPKEPKITYPGIRAAVDGSGAVVWVESHISQAACAYPITPSTPMGDGFAVEYSNGVGDVHDSIVECERCDCVS